MTERDTESRHDGETDRVREMVQNYEALATTDTRATALACLAAGIDAARPERAIRTALSVEGANLRVSGLVAGAGAAGRDDDSAVTLDLAAYDHLLVVGGGKAAAGLVRGLDAVLTGADHEIDGGTVLVPPSAAGAVGSVSLRAGGHPTPTAAGVAGTREALATLDAADDRTLVFAPITGGGSALLAAPREGLSLTAVKSVTEQLLAAGAPIADVNTVRTQLSAVKGGRLAARAAPATVLGLVVSDVVGDDPAVIASGPTVPTDTTPADALAVLDRHAVDAPAVRRFLSERSESDADTHTDTGDGAASSHDASPGESVPTTTATVVIADAGRALAGAREAARRRGYDARVLGRRVTGEARVAGRRAGALAATVADRASAPVVLLAGGETTVTVTGDGTGGPNCEYALAAAAELARRDTDDRFADRVAVAAVDTDGRDGSTDAAGAVVDATTVDTGIAERALARNDSLPVLERTNAAIATGPTGTNVNDLRVIVVE
ncbi:glycerate kinase [Halobaculum sp. MBLA0147]|uniref:glycerate kinase type-2 family protein n=1 Tax=Halobaculum sp. MBLA0147 TaxID=3079934 RepID=UPI0035269C98